MPTKALAKERVFFSAICPKGLIPIKQTPKCPMWPNVQNKYVGQSKIDYTGCFFFSLVPPQKLKYGKPRLGESTAT